MIAEKKRAAERELDLHQFKKSSIYKTGTINSVVIPQYTRDPILGFTVEKDEPKASLYKAIGFNDQKTVKEMVKAETDLGNGEESQKNKQVNIEKKQLELTKKHYRIFYEDELENNKELFPRMVF